MNALTERILAGDIRAIARAATAIENRDPGAQELLRELFFRTGRASTIGITGPPGVGKSTLVDALAHEIRGIPERVAIIAVDPTSPFSGGAILGDRIRMSEHHADPHVFIRSMATRGQVGGLAPATSDLTLLLDAAGFQTILIETVGVGQDEVEIARLADVTCVVLMPGMGDDVQAIKAGMMEIADVFVLNKADRAGIDELERDLRASMSLTPSAQSPMPAVVRCTANVRAGIRDVVEAIRSFVQSKSGRRREAENWAVRLRQIYLEQAGRRLNQQDVEVAAILVAARKKDPYTIVDEWLTA